jgi:hypothetical protein
MKTADRQKLCSHCDGRIPLEAITCPYCNAEQVNMPSSPQSSFKSPTPSTPSSSLYSPPYAGKGLRYSIADEPQQEPVAKKSEMYKEAPSLGSNHSAHSLPPVEKAGEPLQEESHHFWPLLMLSLASILCTVGLLQCFFSENGFLTLEWDSNYWFLYCLVALPLFFFGIKKVNQLK